MKCINSEAHLHKLDDSDAAIKKFCQIYSNLLPWLNIKTSADKIRTKKLQTGSC